MSDAWYIVKQEDGRCEIMSAIQIMSSSSGGGNVSQQERWGPFSSEEEAIARRVGLIRAGKCQPS